MIDQIIAEYLGEISSSLGVLAGLFTIYMIATGVFLWGILQVLISIRSKMK